MLHLVTKWTKQCPICQGNLLHLTHDLFVFIGILKASRCSQQNIRHPGSLHWTNKGKSVWDWIRSEHSEVITPFISASVTCERTVHWLMLNNNTSLHTHTHTVIHFMKVRGQKKREIITDTDPHKRMITTTTAQRGSMRNNSLHYQGWVVRQHTLC